MSKIKRLEIKNFLGISEFSLEPGKVNIIRGPKGIGKSSIVEAIKTAYTNKGDRPRLVRNGEEEATIFVEQDDTLVIDRRLRNKKSNYLKLQKEGGIKSTESELRKILNGDIFRPVDWINRSVKDQTKSILNMLQIEWELDNIEKWFGEIPQLNYDKHILQVLKDIEVYYYKIREDVNRRIKELKMQVKAIKSELPQDYDGGKWKEVNLQELYAKVSKAQEINNYIKEAKNTMEGIETKIASIKANCENEINKIKMQYNDKRQDIKDIITLSKGKIEKATDKLNNIDTDMEVELKGIDSWIETEIAKLKQQAEEKKSKTRQKFAIEKDDLKDLISIQNNKISSKEQELLSLEELENQAIERVQEKSNNSIEKEKIRVGKAAEYIEKTEQIEIEPLREEANHAEEMKTYLRDWDKMHEIINGELAEKERKSIDLTSKIDTARNLPQELIKTVQMPIQGISVNEKGEVEINDLPLANLSDGEKLDLAMRIAKAQAGQLKVICLDRFESLNPAEQRKLLKEIENDDFQYFITSTNSDTFEIEKIS